MNGGVRYLPEVHWLISDIRDVIDSDRKTLLTFSYGRAYYGVDRRHARSMFGEETQLHRISLTGLLSSSFVTWVCFWTANYLMADHV